MPLNIEKIKELLVDSSLTEEEQKDFGALLSQSNDADLEPLVELFSDDPTWMRRLYDNYLSKKQAFALQDKELWEKILQDEEYILTKIEREID